MLAARSWGVDNGLSTIFMAQAGTHLIRMSGRSAT